MLHNKSLYILLGSFVSIFLWWFLLAFRQAPSSHYVAADVLENPLTTATSHLFSGSGNCATCHAPGGPNTQALLDSQGRDVSPVNLWRSTMMANAARDPLWQAKVSAEVAEHPAYQSFIEDKCTTCHAPMGRTEAIHDGRSGYTLAEAQQDPLALDGVSCTVCHQIQPTNLGSTTSFSGKYLIAEDRVIFGPYQNPVVGPMQQTVGYTPVYGAHISQSELCATCHTLFTPTLDNQGNIVGEIPEQTPYLEWLNSQYPAQSIECQSCHVPRIEEGIVIANRPMSLSPRSPFGKHYFVGGNAFMLKLLKTFGAEIGVTASDAAFDSTIARTVRQLRYRTAKLSAETTWDGDTLQVTVQVQNLTGHKFPTGYPSRRAWLVLRVVDAQGQEVFVSGAYDPQTGEIVGLDAGYEPHHTVITSPDQVQIYEAIMGDVDGEVTYVLLRGADYLKDNRLLPIGYVPGGPAYDTTRVKGRTSQDADFNAGGNGSDKVVYRIGGLDGGAFPYRVEVRLLYQSIAPRFAEHLFQYNTAEVQRFQTYYQSMAQTPYTVDSLSLAVVSTSTETESLPESISQVTVFPNPFSDRFKVTIARSGYRTARGVLYDIAGREIGTLFTRQGSTKEPISVVLPSHVRNRMAPGVYYLRVYLDGAEEVRILTRPIVYVPAMK